MTVDMLRERLLCFTNNLVVFVSPSDTIYRGPLILTHPLKNTNYSLDDCQRHKPN